MRASAKRNEFGNQNLDGFQNAEQLALAQMSQLQRKQLDKDGDGSLSAEELKVIAGGRR